MSDNVSFSENKRTILYQTESFEIVSIEWATSSISEMHSHGLSQCMVLIQEGIFENCVDLGFKTELQIYEVGQVVSTPMGSRHSMRCLSTKGKTLHVYTPKIASALENRKFNSTINNNLLSELKISDPVSLDQLRSTLADIRSQSVSTQSVYFMNQLFSGILPQMLMAEDLISQTKTTMATSEASPLFSKIEEEVISELGQIIGWNQNQRHGLCVPGGSSANFMALHCARQKLFPQFKKTGTNGDKFKIYVSSEAHYSMKKACVVLGFGTDALVQVTVDQAGRMRPDLLHGLINDDIKNGFKPLMVCATAGTTVHGAFDPIQEISEICKLQNIWLHVDGAWGGPALFSKKLKHLVNGIQNADSVTFDAHKLFGANLTCSFFLTKHEQILFEANDVSGADYIFHDGGIDRGRLSWQCGRRAEAVSFWTIWKSVGTAGLESFVDKLLKVRDETVAFINSESRLSLVLQPDYLNICVRVIHPTEPNPDWSKKVRASLIENNQAMVNYSADSEGPFLRMILANPYLETMHVKNILNAALEVR